MTLEELKEAVRESKEQFKDYLITKKEMEYQIRLAQDKYYRSTYKEMENMKYPKIKSDVSKAWKNGYYSGCVSMGVGATILWIIIIAILECFGLFEGA